jgi:phosphoribosylglycinamide formyltransferase 1
VAVARSRARRDAPPPGLTPDALGWWPDRGPGARERRETEMARWFTARGVTLLVAAGWLWILSPAFVHEFRGRIINVHPTLLPAFPGRRSVERAVAHGVRVHGVTVHKINEDVDSEIVAQAALAVDDHPDAAEVRRRLAPLEAQLLAEVVRNIASGRG